MQRGDLNLRSILHHSPNADLELESLRDGLYLRACGLIQDGQAKSQEQRVGSVVIAKVNGEMLGNVLAPKLNPELILLQ